MVFSRVVLLLSTFSLIALAASATLLPVPSPIQCTSTGCTVDNYQGSWVDRTPCLASQALFPTSDAELFEAVALASKTRTKIKLVSKGSHSVPKLVCPGGAHGIVVSTQFYNSLIRVNLSSLTVTAHAGVMLRPLLDEVAAHGLALPHTPYWEGVSVAGLISTGAHGSGMWGKGSATHDYVVGMRLIVPAGEEEGYAKVVDLVEGDEDLNAAKLSLGVLGAISHVTFQLEPMFKRSSSVELRGDEHIEDDILEFARQHEFAKIKWYPGARKVLYKMEDRVAVDTVGDGTYKLGIVEKMEVSKIEGLTHALKAIGETQDLDKVCKGEAMMMNNFVNSGDGLKNDGSTFTGYPVVGFNHKMQAWGGCEEEDASPIVTPTHIQFNPSSEEHAHDGNLMTCMWNPAIGGVLFFDTAISIPFPNFRDAMLEVKKLRDLHPTAICSLSFTGGGIHIRFVARSNAYLGASTDSIVFEMVYYRSHEPYTSWMHQDLYEEIEQMLVKKFGGKPHWGKNRNHVFEHMHTRVLGMEKFLDVRRRFDPSGLFSSEWTDAILGITQGVQVFQDHCALEGLCVCKEDSHCNPAKGYFCRAGYVYKEARVCRYEKQDSSA